MVCAPAAAGTRGVATSAPAVAGSIGGSVFPAASAGMMAGAPAAAGTREAATSAPAVAGSVGGSVFPAESAGMMNGAPAAAGSRGAAASVPTVAGGFGGNVFPAESAGMMAGASAAAGSRGAAPVVGSGSGGNAFPAESAGMMAGTPAAAGSSGAAFQAASSAVRPPPAVAFASNDHEDCQLRPTATATRRQAYEVTPAMTRSRSRSSSRHDGVSGAFAALTTGEETIRTLDEDDGELQAGPPHLLVTPETYAQAHAGSHSRIWTEAESKEFEGLSVVGTFVEEGGTKQRGTNIFSAKWVYAWKTNEFVQVVRAKARLVARGFTQREGVDYLETFSPCPCVPSIRLLTAIACELGLDLCHFDAEQAFVQSTLDEEVYLRLPQGCGALSGKVVKLVRSLYGLKQASRTWHNHLVRAMRCLGFEQCAADACVMYVCMYVWSSHMAEYGSTG